MKEFIDIIKADKRSKILFIITIGVLFICTLSYSLSMFSNTKEGNVANINVNGLSFNMTSNTGESDDRILKLKANTLESFNVTLTNLNTMDVKYELIYEVCIDSTCTSTIDNLPEDIIFGISNDSIGKITDTITISDKKDIYLLSNNSTNQDYYIKLNLNAGYSWNELALINQIDKYNNNIDFIAYVDGIEQDKFPDGCYYGYTYQTYEKGTETTDSEVTLTCDNTTGKWKIIVDNIPNKIKVYFKYTVTGKVISQYKNGGTSYLKYDGMTDSTVSNDGTGNLRYYGSGINEDDVPNYISFNNELWRIIGVFETYNADIGTTETTAKIIRNDSLGLYSYFPSDSSINDGWGINAWNEADIMYELNGDYLNPDLTSNPLWKSWDSANNSTTTTEFDKTQSISSKYQQYIMNARWYLGGLKSSSVGASDVYIYERNNTYQQDHGSACGTGCNDTVTRQAYWDGLVALPYVSDFLFAAINNGTSNCSNSLDSTDCSMTYNWMSNIGAYSITPWVESRGAYFVVGWINGTIIRAAAKYSFHIRPTLYLKSNTLINGGNGTISNPYTIE